MNKNKGKITSSFRDPSGFVFFDNDLVYRTINEIYKKDYELLNKSGLIKKLTDEKLLISHKEVSPKAGFPSAYKIILPHQIKFITYPYEWSFGELKDAALLTIKIQKIALEFGMSLKDASAYNIQFLEGKPIFIDTLSFEKYKEGSPWIAYKQFCQHFLAPLALMSYVDLRFSTFSKEFIDGVPLDFASKILPFKTKFSLGIGSHIHLHAKSQTSHADDFTEKKQYNLSKNQLLGIISNLETIINSLKLPKQKTTWDDYYSNTNYSEKASSHKEKLISEWIDFIKPTSVWDACGNAGMFSRIASEKKIFTLSTDFDPLAIECSYQKAKEKQDKFLLPIIIDLINPSAAIGWENDERKSFLGRTNVDLTMALALVHHLAIANNLPFSYIAEIFSTHSKYLIIEFVPKEDSNTKRLLATREDIFPSYKEEDFVKEFKNYFTVVKKEKIKDSSRTLYLMKKCN